MRSLLSPHPFSSQGMILLPPSASYHCVLLIVLFVVKRSFSSNCILQLLVYILVQMTRLLQLLVLLIILGEYHSSNTSTRRNQLIALFIVNKELSFTSLWTGAVNFGLPLIGREVIPSLHLLYSSLFLFKPDCILPAANFLPWLYRPVTPQQGKHALLVCLPLKIPRTLTWSREHLNNGLMTGALIFSGSRSMPALLIWVFSLLLRLIISPIRMPNQCYRTQETGFTTCIYVRPTAEPSRSKGGSCRRE